MKGITPVIAVILLLLITIAIVGIAFTFFQRTTETTTQAGEQQLGQQISQTGISYSIENVDKNIVYVRNRGTSNLLLSLLSFYVDGQKIEANGLASLAPNSVGQYFLNDSKLAMLPDPASLKITGGIFIESKTVCFYCNYYTGYWKFDESSGTIAADSSGNGKNGAITGATWTTGKYGNALNFDGNDYVTGLPGFGRDDNVTYSLWFRTSASGGFLDLEYYRDANNLIAFKNNVRSGVPVGLAECWAYHLSSGVRDDITCGTTTNTFNDNQWHNFVMVWKGGATPDVSSYVDGVLVGRDAATPLAFTWNASQVTATNRVGWNCGYAFNGCVNWNEYFTGQIDDVRVLRVARSMTTS